METLTCQMKPFIQPFERELALAEMRALTGGPVEPLDGDEDSASVFSVSMVDEAETLRGALAYWCSVGEGPNSVTAQLRSEATLASGRGRGGKQSQLDVVNLSAPKLPKRRCLRYGTHGLHEYRGKFFPQLVRALMNIARLPADATVLDPMCGSGTTLVETRLAGRRAIGLDLNPLSVFLTDVKCGALDLGPDLLVEAHSQIKKTLSGRLPRGIAGCRSTALEEHDREYLSRWFHPRTLRELDWIERTICSLQGTVLQGFFRVCLSNIIRGVSWQKDVDLRVRRERVELARGETIARFLQEALRSTRSVAAFNAERSSATIGEFSVYEADARRACNLLPGMENGVDAVVTSPPYATALPYIDTDRLSLVYLGLLSRREHRRRDDLMIGNREVTTGGRKKNWQLYEENRALLPNGTRELIERIDRLNRSVVVGIRRRNLSSLLAKYFLDMREVMKQTMALLRPGGTMFMVVGDNHTTAGGRKVQIDTARQLRELACELGYANRGEVAMDMLPSRDIFKKNSMRTERILRLERA